jgi:beta-lactamase superfamily II metal-dependent hydrolase
MLVDAGFPGNDDRDAKAIAAAAEHAGVKQIDWMVVTHYHRDHVGGTIPLARYLPMKNFIDHGPTTETSDKAKKLYADYLELRKSGDHRVVRPGDQIPFDGGIVTVVAARKKLIEDTLPGAIGEQVEACSSTPRRDGRENENAMSIGFVIDHGDWRMINLADLLWNEEMDLVCPYNKIGRIDLYLSTHHGVPSSGALPLIRAIRPRVAIMNNGRTKGGNPEFWNRVRNTPGLEDAWQLAYSTHEEGKHNVEPDKIVDLEDGDGGGWLLVEVNPDASFSITNSRNDHKVDYKPRS